MNLGIDLPNLCSKSRLRVNHEIEKIDEKKINA